MSKPALPNFGIDSPKFAKLSLIQRHNLCAIKDIGLGSYEHRKAIQQAYWPEAEYSWHHWREARLRRLCEYNWITWAGSGSSAKTTDAARFALQYWLEAPQHTAVIVCSTTIKLLRKRIWNEIAKAFLTLPEYIEFRDQDNNLVERSKFGYAGELIDSDTLIRWRRGDTKNGIFGMAVEEGPAEETVNNLIGIHTHRVFLIIDEMQGIREAIMQATRNMAKNPVFKFLGMGNPESHLDPHGKASEPLTGWPSITQGEDEEWETKGGPILGNGLCQQFYGWKSPAILDKEWGRKNPWMLNENHIRGELKEVNGNENDPRFCSQSLGIWPQMGLDSTLLDTASIEMFNAQAPPSWSSSPIACAALDPAFNGGDSAILQFGFRGRNDSNWQISFTDTLKVPLDSKSSRPIHYQILDFVKTQCVSRSIPPKEVAIDASGEGGGLLSILQQEWGPVQGIESGGAPSDNPVNDKSAKESYDNRSSELCFNLREFALANSIRALPHKAAQQACARRTFYRNGKWCVEPKRGSKGRTDERGRPVKGFKERLGHSPDELDAVNVLIAHCINQGAHTSTTTSSPISSNDWLNAARSFAGSMQESNYLHASID